MQNFLIFENFTKLANQGAILTCNHFNPYDSFAIEKVFRESGQAKEKKLYDLKHELVSAQIKLESTEKAMKSMQDDRSRESKK